MVNIFYYLSCTIHHMYHWVLQLSKVLLKESKDCRNESPRHFYKGAGKGSGTKLWKTEQLENCLAKLSPQELMDPARRKTWHCNMCGCWLSEREGLCKNTAIEKWTDISIFVNKDRNSCQINWDNWCEKACVPDTQRVLKKRSFHSFLHLTGQGASNSYFQSPLIQFLLVFLWVFLLSYVHLAPLPPFLPSSSHAFHRPHGHPSLKFLWGHAERIGIEPQQQTLTRDLDLGPHGLHSPWKHSLPSLPKPLFSQHGRQSTWANGMLKKKMEKGTMPGKLAGGAESTGRRPHIHQRNPAYRWNPALYSGSDNSGVGGDRKRSQQTRTQIHFRSLSSCNLE